MPKFSTIHIFDSNEIQIIDETKTKSFSSSSITNFDEAIAYIKSLKPDDKNLVDYRVIHIFNNLHLSYFTNDNINSFTLKWTPEIGTALSVFFDELISKD